MRWQKEGLVFRPSGRGGWLASHASLPIARGLGGDRWRVYFSSRDEGNRSSTGFFDMRLGASLEILDLAEEPVLKPGPIGAFDDAGAMGACLVEVEDRVHLYYVGWSLARSVPFRNALGLAVSEDGGQTFEKISAGPILDRGIHDPAFVAACDVLVENGVWRMWYLSCLAWERHAGKLRHRYHIKYAESRDGIEWQRTGRVCVDFRDSAEYAISRPCVVRDRDAYRMWYSCRGSSYRVGYAESEDGLVWVRRDDAVGIDVSAAGWDSEMIEYAWVFDHDGSRWMLYNGNGFGATGIGLARLAEL